LGLTPHSQVKAGAGLRSGEGEIRGPLMPSLVADGLISPELVLVASPEEAEEARAALPDVYELYDWIRGVRDLVPVEIADAHGEENRRGFAVFTLLTCLNAIVPLVLIIVWRSVS
jgi:hypothetical protein